MQAARLMRDRNMNHCIEVLRGHKWVHVIIREPMKHDDGALRLTTQCRKMRLDVLRPRERYEGAHEITSDGRFIGFDDRFKPIDPKEYPLEKAVGHFLKPSMGGRVTARADEVLRAILSNKVVTEDLMTEDNEQQPSAIPPASDKSATAEGASDVSKKAKKSKAKKSGKKGGAPKRNGACAKVWDIAANNKSLTRKEIIEKCVKAGVNKATASTQYQKYLHRNDK